MTEKLCESLKKTGHYICLTTHTPLPVSIQQLCDGYIYDADNSFQINGLPEDNLSHSMAEIKSVHDALNYLDRFGFTEFFKLTYDCDPTTDYSAMITKAQQIMEETNKSMISSGWGVDRSIASLLFYSKIDFYRKITSLDTPEKWCNTFEERWYWNAEDLGLANEIYQSNVRLYDDYIGFRIRDFAHQGGKEVDPYPY